MFPTSSQKGFKSKIKPDRRPSEYEYALISKHVYSTDANRPIEGSMFQTIRTWKVIYTRSTTIGYFGAIYQCDNTKQIVIAHRGTNSLFDLYEDLQGIFLNKCSRQKDEASLLVNLVVHQIRANKGDYQLSFTGHSLGAFLAELSVYYATTTLNFPNVSAVTFESPGSKQSIQSLKVEHEIFAPLYRLSPDQIRRLDITTYLCYPNIINGCNEHVGTIYAINVDVASPFFAQIPGLRLIRCHGIDGIVDWFKTATSDGEINHPNSKYKRLHMSAWPRGYSQISVFFKYAVLENGMFKVDPDLIQHNPPPSSLATLKAYEAEDCEDFTSSSTLNIYKGSSSRDVEKWFAQQRKKFKLRFFGNFQVLEILHSFNVMPLHHFSRPMQHFLKEFYERMQLVLRNNENEEGKVKELFKDVWKFIVRLPSELIEDLLTFEIRVNKMYIEEVAFMHRNRNVYDFRRDLSSWLATTGTVVQDLVCIEVSGNLDRIKDAAVRMFSSHYDIPPIS